jgi:uncharacterized glyoxalase superfamily protein PhnB
MSIYPALRYDDPNTALDWLTKAFGFTPVAVHRDDDGTVGHAVLRLGTGMVLVSGPRPAGWLGGVAANPLAGPISVYAVVDDPDAHHAVAAAEGATVIRPPEDMDYGSREYSARDPEGNLWSFGTYRPDA